MIHGNDKAVTMFTVSFFGHRIIPSFNETEKQLESLIDILLTNNAYTEFLIGRNGEFDQIVSSVIRRVKRNKRDDNSSLIWILPYSTAELRNNKDNFLQYYDEIEICHTSANSYPQRAFQIRNQYMVDRSDLIVFYVKQKSDGAYRTMCYAKQQQKNIINLAEK